MTARKPRATPKPIPADEAPPISSLEPGQEPDGTERMAADSDAGVELTGDGAGEPLPALPLQVYNNPNWYPPEGYGQLRLVSRGGHLYVDGQLPGTVAFSGTLWDLLTGTGNPPYHSPYIGVNEDRTTVAVSAVGVSFAYELEEEQTYEGWKTATLLNLDMDDDAEFVIGNEGLWFRG